MNTVRVHRDEATLHFNDNEDAKDRICSRLLEFFMLHDAYSGESIVQSDAVQENAAELLADIAEGYFEFDVEWDEED